MKSIRCPTCKMKFRPPERGRRPRYCSPACRQKAYRKRAANPLMRLWQSDYVKIKDRDNRKKQAIKALEDLDYIVTLQKGRGSILPKQPKPNLAIVPKDE